MGNEKKYFLMIFVILFFVVSIAYESKSENDKPNLILSKPPSSENYPCSKCHKSMPVNRKKRKLEANHKNITLKHAGEERWCFDCHEGDKLKLPSGQLIAYDKPYILCMQCHGTEYRDWKIGIHGKVTGMWNGDRLYRLCVNCHDPHQPRFKAVEPKQPPMKPSDIK